MSTSVSKMFPLVEGAVLLFFLALAGLFAIINVVSLILAATSVDQVNAVTLPLHYRYINVVSLILAATSVDQVNAVTLPLHYRYINVVCPMLPPGLIGTASQRVVATWWQRRTVQLPNLRGRVLCRSPTAGEHGHQAHPIRDARIRP